MPAKLATSHSERAVRLGALSLAFTAAACGARSELWEPGSECEEVRIGIFGRPGAHATSDFEQWLRTSGASVQRLQTGGEPITAETLEAFDVVVLDWLARDYTASEAAIFADWIAAGGGVMSMSGWNGVTTDDWHANSLLAPLEIAYGGPLLSGPVTDLEPHPTTAGLTSVVFEGGYAISDLGGAASTRTPIASLPAAGGEVNVGYAVEMGSGRAFVWGDEWIEFTSKASTFPPRLWVQVFTWLAPATRCTLAPPS